MEDRKCQEDQKLQEVLVKTTPLAVCPYVVFCLFVRSHVAQTGFEVGP